MNNKIREDFEKWNTLKYGDPVSGTTWSWEAMTKSFAAGYNSRDKEVEELKNDIDHLKICLNRSGPS